LNLFLSVANSFSVVTLRLECVRLNNSFTSTICSLELVQMVPDFPEKVEDS
jgi:hypothetical protein